MFTYRDAKEHTFHKKDGSQRSFVIRRCRDGEAQAIMAMQERAAAQILEPGLYVFTSMADIVESLRQDVCLGAYDGGQIVGYTMLLSLRPTPRNLACHLDYDPQQALLCATCDGTWVDPAYQGFGLQYFFSRVKDPIAQRMGARELLACTSPDNHASLASLRRNGYEIIHRRELYGGYDRYILRKPVADP